MSFLIDDEILHNRGYDCIALPHVFFVCILSLLDVIPEILNLEEKIHVYKIRIEFIFWYFVRFITEMSTLQGFLLHRHKNLFDRALE